MSNRPVLEEIDDDDIDNLDMDIAQFDPTLNTPIAPLRPQPTVVRSQDQHQQQQYQAMPSLTDDVVNVDKKEIVDSNKFTDEDRIRLQSFQVLYPCYFDKNRSHKEGRRVSVDKAVVNPLAKTISDACRALHLNTFLELDKTHPQDFGNPGRVRILIKDKFEDGKVMDLRFTCKRSLLNAVASYLQAHPTTLSSIGPGSGIPLPQEYETGFEPLELPLVKGFRMNTIVPVHSSLTMKHPMTKSIYDPLPEQPSQGAIKPSTAPKQPKKKIMKIRG
ncbi:signal recognition particle subunit [Scheffersomyces spartinae]|uniref:Signal recognition particle SEC65 subunit n=1 Tax=Scheffersomyces spartinae TaxID=45513 RepID=A0A9P8AIW9_9ASCO|nr:signal recognition particle subunit [Scheffersomyces spartinae]KAG7194130.1 signal recognition particle subunit [Scheffersomyces spartinae]